MRRHPIESYRRRIEYASRTQEYKIWFFGDVHYGSALCDEKCADETIEQIRKQKNALVFLMGDLADYIAVRDKRFEDDLLADWIDRRDIVGSETQYIKKKLAPIADKVIGVLDGNHEHKIQREFSLRVKNDLLYHFQKYQWVDLGYSALTHLSFHKVKPNSRATFSSLRIYLHHGWGGGRTAADANHFMPLFATNECDWAIMGHTHKRYAGDIVCEYIDRHGQLAEKKKLWGRSGTFLKTLEQGRTGYGERAGYPPVARGALCVTYYPDKQDWSWMG